MTIPTRLLRALSVSTLVLCVPGGHASARATQDRFPIDLTTLNGKWSGIIDMRQRGACTLRPGTARNQQGTVATLTFRPDGLLIGRFLTDPRAGYSPTDDWVGHVKPDLTLEVARVIPTPCNGQMAQIEVRYTGRIERKKDRWRLVVAGDYAVCTAECRFLRTISLQRDEH